MRSNADDVSIKSIELGCVHEREAASMPDAQHLLIFEGNCQAQHLAAMAQSANGIETIFVGSDWGFVPAYRGRGCKMVSEKDAAEVLEAEKAAGKRLIQFSQSSPFAKQLSKPMYAAAEKKILFPMMALWAMAPKRFAERHKAAFDAERIFELDVRNNAISQEKAGFKIDVAGFIEREITHAPLFHTVNHPAGAVLAQLMEGLVLELRDELDTAPLLEIAADASSREGLNFLTDHPVDSDLRARLGFAWGDRYESYGRMLVSTENKDWDEFESSRAEYEQLFSDDTQFWRCLHLYGRARKDDSIAFFAGERLLELCPGVSNPWMLYAQLLSLRERKSEVSELLMRAKRFFADTSAFFGLAARIYLMMNDLPKAMENARTHWRLSSDKAQAAEPLIKALVAEKKFDEAKEIIASFRGRSAEDKKLLHKLLLKFNDADILLAELGT